MSEDRDPRLIELRAALDDAAKIEDLAERTLEVVSIVDAVASPLGIGRQWCLVGTEIFLEAPSSARAARRAEYTRKQP